MALMPKSSFGSVLQSYLITLCKKFSSHFTDKRAGSILTLDFSILITCWWFVTKIMLTRM